MQRYWVLGYQSLHRNTVKPGWLHIGASSSRFYNWLTERVAIRLHQILRSDDDRALHDHPFDYVSLILSGGYWEVTEMDYLEYVREASSKYKYAGFGSTPDTIMVKRWYGPGSILFRTANSAHRLILDRESNDVWTLFIMGPKKQNWGFYTKEGKIPASVYLGEQA